METIMEKTADLAMIKKMNIDTLLKESKSQRLITERCGCLQSASFTRSGLKLESVHQESLRSDVFRKRATKPLLNQRQHQKRLTWAKDKKDWTAAQWSKVLFSDESKFFISFGNQGPRVWRKSGEAQNPRCLKSSVTFPQSVMIWADMSSAGVGPLCFLKSTVNTAVYLEILEHFMLLSADKLYGEADFIFQQDLAPAHTAKECMEIVKRKMRDTRPNNADDLRAAIKATWASIPPQQCHKLITSMSRRIEAVIKAK
ncbi:Transposable element Tc1 transposase [Labeo rohita]|uniref:Transposable element Tc1 transposase n=1 Tax=Labeo rohita TaxID=84645 RepID=A0ABQ8L7K5_LABRO|nr:Transposable element Tc1 transposase [Labeo rohita]